MIVTAISGFSVSGCDDAFVPLAPGDAGMSVYGYLDASADTQWIRVMPVRDVVVTSPDPLGATVTLEEVGTGRAFELNDSVFRFPPLGPDVGSEGVYVHNFWTIEPINPGATYRFSARVPGAAPVEAAVDIPPEYETEVWVSQRRMADLLRVFGLRHVAFAGFLTYFRDDCGEASQYRPFRIPSTSADEHSIPISLAIPEPFRAGCGRVAILEDQLAVLGSGAPWPSGPGGASGSLGSRDFPSNVTHAVGFLGGALSRRLPYEGCRLLGFEPPEYCVLRYDKSTATVVGRVVDASCGSGTVARAIVELLELSEARNPRLRPTVTNRSGEFSIAAVEGGKRYALTVRPPLGGPFFGVDADTFDIAAGETLRRDARLSRSCEP